MTVNMTSFTKKMQTLSTLGCAKILRLYPPYLSLNHTKLARVLHHKLSNLLLCISLLAKYCWTVLCKSGINYPRKEEVDMVVSGVPSMTDSAVHRF